MLEFSNARECQDLFVLCVLDGKRQGTYVEIGANQPIIDSNTFLLESKFGWKGISFEWHPPFIENFNRIRKNPCIGADATTVDLTNIIRAAGLGPHIDFLQVDIDPPSNTIKALHRVDFNRFEFSVATFEHDLYAGGDAEREESRAIFHAAGYTRVVSDVSHGERKFEDWYVNERHMPNDNWRLFLGEGLAMDPVHMNENIKATFERILRKFSF